MAKERTMLNFHGDSNRADTYYISPQGRETAFFWKGSANVVVCVVSAHACSWAWRSREDTGASALSLFLWGKYLMEPGTTVVAQKFSCLSSFTALELYMTTLIFYMGSGDFNSGFQSCAINILAWWAMVQPHGFSHIPFSCVPETGPVPGDFKLPPSICSS